ncbi:MAG TPA: TetR/AcrR family transcriptional regulator [Chitinophagaceae bacterium]|nr:TetR/AcrR family transcriptional regulator [Chitinophagaceae bacterium]
MRTRDDNKIQAIRAHAVEMIVKQGFDGFSMQKLAKAAGVSPATLYIYYKDREDLIMQLWAASFSAMATATLKNFDPSMSFSEGLRVQWLNRAKYCLKYPQEMQFMEQLRHSPLQEKALEMVDGGFKNAMYTFVNNAIKKNELVKVQLEVYWSIAFAPMYNLVKFHLEGQSIGGKKFTLTDKVLHETLALVIKALTP